MRYNLLKTQKNEFLSTYISLIIIIFYIFIYREINIFNNN